MHFVCTTYIVIHPKRWFPRLQESADNLEFSEKYQDYTVCKAIDCHFPYLCLVIAINTLKHIIFSTKMSHWHQILVIFMIYALLSWIFCRDLHIFSANFCWAKSQTPPICLLFGCKLIAGKLLSWLLSNGRKMPCPVTVRSGITSKNYEDVIGELLLV